MDPSDLLVHVQEPAIEIRARGGERADHVRRAAARLDVDHEQATAIRMRCRYTRSMVIPARLRDSSYSVIRRRISSMVRLAARSSLPGQDRNRETSLRHLPLPRSAGNPPGEKPRLPRLHLSADVS